MKLILNQKNNLFVTVFQNDQAMVEKVAESMAPLAILGGESVSDILSRLLKGTVLENALKKPPSDS